MPDYSFPRNLFPSQRVTKAEREDAKWYANSCDAVIAFGEAVRNSEDSDYIDEMYNILHGNIPEVYYKKTLNPYNATDPQYLRFPAVFRNYDIMNGVIRRFVGEYIKNPHDFIVGANNPEVVLAKNAKLASELMKKVEEAIASEIQILYQQYVEGGGNPEEFNIQNQFNVEEFIDKFNKDYIDNISQQGQDLLAVIDDITDSVALYARAYFEFIAFGRCFTYTDVIGNKLVKRVVSVRDAFPVPNDSVLVEDYDMFAERRKMSYQQIMDEFGDYFDDNQIKFLETWYARDSFTNGDMALLKFGEYRKYFSDVCAKFSSEELKKLQNDTVMARDLNTGLYDVWHAVWRGEVKHGILTYQQNGFITTRIVDEDYQLDTEAGDISIEWIWEPQVFESIRIGTRANAIYPYKARAIAYNRNGKLPYNGLMELLPGLGRFSVIDIVLPYQIFGNIVAYYREMAIAKNKLNILLMAKSLLGEVPEDTIYKMAADGILYIDDENDAGMVKAQQIRMLQSNMNDYITQLTNLINDNEQRALLKVDMPPQRFGEIANSAGKGVTDEAINRGSMGTVIIDYVFDLMREHDYNRDLDYSKLAWIEGLNTSYRDKNRQLKYLSLDVNSHIFADYIVKCKFSKQEQEKLEQYKQLAFSAAQNGDIDMAALAIDGDNPSEIRQGLEKLRDINRKHEETLKQMDMQNNQMLQEFELQKIKTKGEEDRKTLQLEKYLDGEIEMIKANANIMSFNNDLSDANKAEAEQRMQEASNNIEREKLNLEREKMYIEARTKDKEIGAKLYDSDNKLKIARANKNKYDKK